MSRQVCFVAVVLCLLPPVTSAQQRDVPAPGAPVALGSGEITGVILTNDSAPRPVRHAVVTLSGDVPAARSTITDDAGRFTFGRLPAGRFTVTAKKAAYLPAAYGTTKPGRPGTAISLAAGARVQITMTMARGAVVTGIIRDQNGAPISGVQVAALDVRLPSSIGDPFGNAEIVATSDDRGVFRIYGLPPSEYVIAAAPRMLGTGEIGRRSASEMDALLADLAQRSGSRTTSPTMPFDSTRPSAPIPTPPPVGFAPTYYPGTSLFAEAVRLRVASGEERSGLDFPVGPVPVAAIAGTISGDVRSLAAVQLSIVVGGPRLSPQLGTSPVLSERPNAEGRFKFTNVAPGSYRIVARASPNQAEAPQSTVSFTGASGGSGSFTSLGSGRADPREYLYAIADVDVRGQDVTGVALALRPGSTFSGRVATDAAAPGAPIEFSKLRVSISPPGGTYMSSTDGTIIGNTFSAVPPVTVRADGTFDVTSIAPGTYRLAVVLPPELTKIWSLRSAVAAGRDLLDAPLDFVPGVDFAGVMLTLSDRHTEIAGTLQTPAGQPATEYFVIVFPADRALWRAGARRMQSVRPASDGRFTVPDLPAGDYLIAALTDVDPAEWQDPSFLDQVVPAGVKVTLAEGERKTQDLRIKEPLHDAHAAIPRDLPQPRLPRRQRGPNGHVQPDRRRADVHGARTDSADQTRDDRRDEDVLAARRLLRRQGRAVAR